MTQSNRGPHPACAAWHLTVAKRLAGGVPLSGVVGARRDHGCAHARRPGRYVCGQSAGLRRAVAVLDLFEEEQLLASAHALGETLRGGLDQLARAFPAIDTVRGVGAMLALEFVKDSDPFQADAAFAQRVIDRCREGGLLVIKCGVHRNNVRLLAPPNTSGETAREALEILRTAIALNSDESR